MADLAHYGVKGMKWGIRKNRSSSVTVNARPGKLVKTEGGYGLNASTDAKRAAVSRQKAKKSSVDSLSNDELRDLVQRMNLEQQYKQLSTNRMSLGESFVHNQIEAVKKNPVNAYNQNKNLVGPVFKKNFEKLQEDLKKAK